MSSVNRPLSPHIEVYRPQLTSLMSIFNRATGLALSIGTVFLVWQLLAAASGPAAFADFQALAGSWIGLLVLIGWSLSLFYHLTNGIRHLVWDAGYGFDMPTAYRSGHLVLVATLALTVIAWLAALIIWGGK